jgi:hypothetical protein
VVFVHGLIGPLADPVVLDAMAPADTLAADLRGYGARASHPVEGLTIDDQVDALEGEITASTCTSPTAMRSGPVDWPRCPSTYEPMLRRVFAAHPVHLVTGTRSRAGWDVPEWAFDAAATYQAIPDCGHMVMLEQPHRLATLLATLVHQEHAQAT